MSRSNARSWTAFGSIALRRGHSRPARSTTRAAAVERIVDEFDLACSRFRDDSELSALNAAAGAAVRVGPVLLEAVSAALRAARLTDGDVDPTVGRGADRARLRPRLRRRGRSATRRASAPRCSAAASFPAGGPCASTRERCDDPASPRGVNLDLGATAKALAADRAAAAARAAAGCGVLVVLRRRPRDRRAGAAGGVARARHRRPSRRRRRARASGSRSAPAGWRRRARPCGGGGPRPASRTT